MKELLTPQEMYRIASKSEPLPDNFGQSLMKYVLKHEREWFYPAFGNGIRAAIGQAMEWILLDDHSYHGQTILRRISIELCRHSVPQHERVL